MSWRLRSKLRKAPAGGELVAEKLEEFESKMREATAAPRGTAMNHELTWPVHRLHFEKNRYIYELRYVREEISDVLLKFLVKEKIADGALIAKWRKPGYDTLCSLSVVTRSNTNFGTVGICRTPLKDRQGQIMPNVQTGCVCCVSGCGGPIWWNDPVPEIVRKRILDVDPGKAPLLEGSAEESGSSSFDAKEGSQSGRDGEESDQNSREDAGEDTGKPQNVVVNDGREKPSGEEGNGTNHSEEGVEVDGRKAEGDGAIIEKRGGSGDQPDRDEVEGDHTVSEPLTKKSRNS